MSTVAFIRRCLSVGMDFETALLAAEQFEAKPAPMVPVHAPTAPKDSAAEKKRIRDRERMAAKREAERVARQSQNGRQENYSKSNGVAEVAGDVAATVAGDTRDQGGDGRGDTSCARVRDNNPNLDTTGSVGGGVGVEREGASQTDDWPKGDLAKLLIDAAESPWLDRNKSLGLVTSAGRIEAWKRRGASWERHVLPVVIALAKQHGEPINGWKFFEPAIARAVQASRAEVELPDVVVPFRGTGPPRKSREEQNRDGWDYAIARIAEDEQRQN